MIAEQLKAETKETHLALEKMLVPQIKKVASKEEYTKLLRLFYGYYKPLEDKIAMHISTQYMPDYADRRQAKWLLEDMASSGMQVSSLSAAGHLPVIENAAQAMGALYVLEGSALGGKIIKKMLQGSMGIAGDEGLRFFSGYGENTGMMWQHFLNAINRFATDKGNGREITAAANETFARFKEWVEEQDNVVEG